MPPSVGLLSPHSPEKSCRSSPGCRRRPLRHDIGGCQMRQTTKAEGAWNEAKPRVPDPRAEQPERLAANEAGCARISLRCASVRRKIALNGPGNWGMSAKMAPQLVSRVSPGLQA